MNAKCYFRNDKSSKKFPEFKTILHEIRKIKTEIYQCRVKITIGQGNSSDSYELSIINLFIDKVRMIIKTWMSHAILQGEIVRY